jgi:hypothetical protein
MECVPTSYVEVGYDCDGYTIVSILGDDTVLVSYPDDDNMYVATLTGEVWLSKPFYIRFFDDPEPCIKSIGLYIVDDSET